MLTNTLRQCWAELEPLVESGAATSGVLLVRVPGKEPQCFFLIDSEEKDLPPIIESLEGVVDMLKQYRARRHAAEPTRE